MPNNTNTVPWWLERNWTPFLKDTYHKNGVQRMRPTEVDAIRNIVRECRQHEYKNLKKNN